MSRSDEDWMGVALSLARRGLGDTWPNPSVGCVIVKDGRVVGRGRTATGGRPHAEVQALTMARSGAKGATAFVTLEPCSHTGRSPPCTDALIKAGISRVVIAQSDPNPEVDGVKALTSAGVQVTTDVRRQEAEVINAGFTSTVTRGRPFLTLKLAMTLDGKIATAAGESRWITGPAARRKVHLMRITHDAVMIGRGTAAVDDPMLDIRDMGDLRNPVRVVLDSALSLTPDLKLLRTAKQQPTWIVHRPGATPHEGYDACTLIEAEDLVQTMRRLATAGLTRVLCEGGGTLAASLLQADLVDELVVFAAGKLIGADGLPGVASLETVALDQAPNFKLKMTQAVGEDVLSRWVRREKP